MDSEDTQSKNLKKLIFFSVILGILWRILVFLKVNIPLVFPEVKSKIALGKYNKIESNDNI